MGRFADACDDGTPNTCVAALDRTGLYENAGRVSEPEKPGAPRFEAHPRRSYHFRPFATWTSYQPGLILTPTTALALAPQARRCGTADEGARPACRTHFWCRRAHIG